LTLGIRAKLFLLAVGLIIVSMTVAYAYMRSELDKEITDSIRADLEVRARLVAMKVESELAGVDDLAAWDALADELGTESQARVTIIRRDGKVLGDSKVPLSGLPVVENHAQRPEVKAALATGHGESSRLSHTIDERMIYMAVPLERAGQILGVARVAMPLTQVDAAIGRLRAVLSFASVLALGVAVILASAAAELASKRARLLTAAARRMAAGDLESRGVLQGEDEFAELSRALDQLARSLSASIRALRAERDRLSGLLAGMQEGVLLLDAENKVMLVNPALRGMLLLGVDAVGKTPLEVIRHADLKELFDEVATHGEPLSREIDVAGLRPRRLLVRVAPLAGEQQGLFAVFVDVTEVRKLESLRRDFVANVSHELRTPVTAIRSAAETVQSAAANDPTAAVQFIDIIARNAERLHGLVEDLLDLSRIESRELRLSMEPLDSATIFSHVASLFKERAEKKHIRLIDELPRNLAPAQADRRALEHVLTNLVDNAVKYCGSGAEIRLKAQENGESLRLVVEDTGPGIEARHLPRVFERFYRVDPGRSRELGGTGLGLSIVKHLAESMGGTVGVESTPGVGTKFSLTLRKGTPLAA
jgi:two-component system, OmpR family, phosphate regulon sensor histidine kinase PhoR